MNLTISLTGLRVAQQMIELVGTNIANISTDGYHRQDAVIEPDAQDRLLGTPIGGARVRSYRRSIDTLLEDQILHQYPQLSQMNRELWTLQSIESAFGRLDAQGLSSELNEFFGALRELSADPTSEPLRQQAVWAADSLTGSFRHLANVLSDLDEQILKEAQIVIQDVNTLADTIADLNGQVEMIMLRGGSANLLTDERDQAVLELSELIEIQTSRQTDRPGIVNIWAIGQPLVANTTPDPLQVSEVGDGELGLAAEDGFHFETEIGGGKLGGLFALRNDLVAGIQTDLDDLANQLMREINRIHLQGVGLTGSFDRLTGVGITDPDAALVDWNEGIATGSMHLRLVAPTGEITRHTVQIDAATDTLNTVAARLNAIDPTRFSASVINGTLRLEGLAGYRFDFLPTPALELGPPWTGTSTPTESGTYTGSADETYTFTATGTGTVGVDAGLTVEVRNRADVLVATLDVGNTYVPGTPLAVEEGLSVALAAGTITAAEQFAVEALAAPAGPAFEMSNPWNGTSTPEASGMYTGSANDTFTFTVQGGGRIGVDADIAVEVRNAANELVTTLDVGNGYAAGDRLEVHDGIHVAFDVGTVADGEKFVVQALAESDPTGFLAAAGIGTLFGGSGAFDMAVRQEIMADPRRLATAEGAEMSDNATVRRMADIAETELTGLGNLSVTDAFRLLVTGVGQKISIRQARLEAMQSMMQGLENQREEISGVDLNEEAAKLVVFEKMFQGLVKYLGVQKDALDTLIELL
ncbi:MAG: flagellar hook-associated protein FlgK [Phycisphaerae bacterium]